MGKGRLGVGVSTESAATEHRLASVHFEIRSEGDNPATVTVGGGEVMDMGEQDGARGEVLRDDEGIHAYVVAPGDAPMSIGERLCMSYSNILLYNKVIGPIHPGQVLNLRPEPGEIWESPHPD